jgi:MSHA pilin protein MshA
MQPRQTGFTLIELVIVIVVLGILAAVAMPRLQNIDTDARKAATQGTIAALQSAATITYAVTHGASTLASIKAQAQFSDPLVTFTPTLCSSGADSTMWGNYTIGGVVTPLVSFTMGQELCSG